MRDGALPEVDVPAWADDPALRHRLEDAGWRYATLVGVVDPDDSPAGAAVLMADRARYGHMVRRDQYNRLLWDDAEMETFLHEVTGAPRPVCAAWIAYDWPV